MFTEIGSFDAKTKLSQLLQGIKRGQRYTITLRGEPIADLVPSESSTRRSSQTAIEALRSFHRVKGISPEQLATWIAEGRQGWWYSMPQWHWLGYLSAPHLKSLTARRACCHQW